MEKIALSKITYVSINFILISINFRPVITQKKHHAFGIVFF